METEASPQSTCSGGMRIYSSEATLTMGRLENNADILLKFSANSVVSSPNWKIRIRVSLRRKENAFLSLTRARGSVTRH